MTVFEEKALATAQDFGRAKDAEALLEQAGQGGGTAPAARKDAEAAPMPAEQGTAGEKSASEMSAADAERPVPAGGEPAAADPLPGGSPGRFLKNPLPVPKRRPHARMEFDLLDDWDIPEDGDHFDYEISEEDDFDI